MEKKKTLNFLFGSGISCAVGMPGTEKITDKILEGYFFHSIKKTIWHGTSDGYYNPVCYKYPDIVFDTIKEIYQFAMKNNTNTLMFNRTNKRHAVNYEDLIFFLRQISIYLNEDQSLLGSILVNKCYIEDKVKGYNHIAGNDEFPSNFSLPEAAINYIRRGVTKELEKPSYSLENIDTICNAITDKTFQQINIFTLNHDLLLENLLKEIELKYEDGFGRMKGDLRQWKPSLFDRSMKSRIRILKLHGSIDWRSFENTNTKIPLLAIYEGVEDIDHKYVKIPGPGIPPDNMYHFPMLAEFLIGTEDKIQSYLIGHNWELFSRFRKYLHHADNLIVAGYGFYDEGINDQIMDWLINHNNKKMIVINNKKIEEFRDESRFIFRDQDRPFTWHKLRDNGKIIYLEQGIEKHPWKEIKQHLI